MRLASTTSNGGLARRQAARRAPGSAGRAGSGARSRASPRRRSGRCRRRGPAPRRAGPPRWPGSRSRSRRRGRARRRARRDRRAASSAARHSRVVGWRPVPNAIPGSSARTTSSGCAPVPAPGRPDDDPPPDAQDREVRLPGLGPVGLVDDARPELADRPQPERLEVAERLGDLGDGALGGGGIAGRQVGPDRRRPGRVDARAEALVDEVEGRLDGRAAGRDPAEDLADGLDRLDVGLDRELEPGAGPRSASRRRPALTRARASRAARPTRGPSSPPSAASSVSSSRWRFESLVGTTTSTSTWRSPRDPARRRCGTPLPRRRISVSGWVPGLDLDLLVAVDGRDRDPRPERGLGDRDLGLVEELGALALERRVRRDVDRDVEAAGRAAARARPRPRSRAGSGGPRRCRPGS